MGLKLANMAASRLSQNISDTAISLQLQPGDGAKFPSLGGSDWFPVAVVNDFAQVEYMRCIGRSGDTLTVQRGQEGSLPRAYSAGDVVELRLTLAALEEMRLLGVSP